MDAAPPNETKEDNMAEVSKLLQNIQKDLTEVKQDLKKTVKEEKLENIVTNIIKKLIAENNKEREQVLCAEMEKRCEALEKKFTKRVDRMAKNIEVLEGRVETLTEKYNECTKEVRGMEKILRDSQLAATEALRRSNLNEQYSRKTNFKIMGLPEEEKENTCEVVKSFLKKTAKVELPDREIIIAHRIPGPKGKPRPIIVKVLNTSVKSRIMRKRSTIKEKGGGYRLADDVTKPNGELIRKLLEFEGIESAWYFNGAVYGKYKDKRIRFDICDNIEEKLKHIK